MVSLAKTPQEIKQDTADMPMVMTGSKPSGPEYPYGCCISLDDETLEKLGLDGDMPAAGEMIRFTAVAKVTCSNIRDEIDSTGATKKCLRVEMQITDMDVASGSPVDEQIKKSAARRERFYGTSEPDGDED